VGIYPKELKLWSSRYISTFKFIAALFTMAKIWKQPYCPSAKEWVKKMWHKYTVEHMEDVMLWE
jgi:hypothetical protein